MNDPWAVEVVTWLQHRAQNSATGLVKILELTPFSSALAFKYQRKLFTLKATVLSVIKQKIARRFLFIF